MTKSGKSFEPQRRQLAHRRPALTFTLTHDTLSGARHRFLVTVGLYDRNSPDVGEVFINTAGKAGNESDTMVSDAAVAISLALQYGCPLDVLRSAMKRDTNGDPMGLLSHVLDAVAKTVNQP